MGPTTTWLPRHQNHLAKPLHGQICSVLKVRWSKLSGFGIGWPKPNRGKSSMAKNRLYSWKNVVELFFGPVAKWTAVLMSPELR